MKHLKQMNYSELMELKRKISEELRTRRTAPKFRNDITIDQLTRHA